MSLPNSVNYSDIPASLKPDVYSTTMVINPVNTRSYYTAGDQIIFDYNSGVRGFIDPKSIYLSYKVGLATTNAANAPSIIGTPVYSTFLKLDTFINSQNIETVSLYNQVCQAWVQCSLSVADKAGLQSAYGYRDSDGNDTLLSMFDHHLCTRDAGNDDATDGTDSTNWILLY